MCFNITMKSHEVFANNTSASVEEISTLAQEAIKMADTILNFVETRQERFLSDAEFCNKVYKNVQEKIFSEFDKVKDVKCEDPICNPIKEIHQYLGVVNMTLYHIACENRRGVAENDNLAKIKKMCGLVKRDAGFYADPEWKGEHHWIPASEEEIKSIFRGF